MTTRKARQQQKQQQKQRQKQQQKQQQEQQQKQPTALQGCTGESAKLPRSGYSFFMPDSLAAPENDARRGLILINTGPGKGKTTAALGTAFRAAGNGMRVLVLQFLKGSWHYGELDAAEALSAAEGFRYVMRQMGRGFVKVGGAESDPEDLRMVEQAWAEATEAILSGDWDLIVLDEINYAIGYKMLDAEAVAEVLRRKPEMLHVILTGRNAAPVLVELADTVTEMREVKHAYQRGILAQRGIEF